MYRAQLLRLQLQTPEQLKAVSGLEKLNYGVDFWLEPSMKRPVDIYVPQKNLHAVKLFLNQFGIQYEVSIPDVGELITKTAIGVQQDDEMGWDSYQTYDIVKNGIK
jgi:hypothetical protein